ncbi:hypothetical protein BP6252_10963 [Coleophoma cylindrospora]|uniref:Transcription factor domain-containing protein n=1 Tax=Coleophoma cylindrospora TaxID=1849047 RepID=A0A3D8QP11_9HELO|nr:hypothetical protein BP6252_10963 [Coleophoma cylindrospora]
MANDPKMVIFNSNLPVGAGPPDSGIQLSWKHGPSKIKSGFPRGRPRKVVKKAVTSPAFQFVDCADLQGQSNAATRKSIRSHVMRHRKPKLDKTNNDIQTIDPVIDTSVLQRRQTPDQARSEFAVVPREFTMFDPFDCLSLTMQPYMAETLSKCTTYINEMVFCIEKYSRFNPMRDYFLPMAFQDPALFHALLFSSNSLNLLSSGHREAPKAVQHLNESIRIVNERLQSPSLVVEDSTIAVIATIAYIEKVAGNFQNWDIHMRGLKRMVQLRGGLKNFQSNRILYNKIQRSDLCGSVDAGTTPYFQDFRPHSLGLETPYTYSSIGFNKLNNIFQFTREFNQILHEVEQSTFALNRVHFGDTQASPLDLRYELTSIQYWLLRLQQSPCTSRRSKIENMTCLGLQLYLITILNDLPPEALSCDNLVTNLKTALDDPDLADLPLGFRCWVLFLMGILVCDTSQKFWTIRTFASLVLQPGPHANKVLESELVTFFWVGKVHDISFTKFWSEVMNSIG